MPPAQNIVVVGNVFILKLILVILRYLTSSHVFSPGYFVSKYFIKKIQMYFRFCLVQIVQNVFLFHCIA
uniref:Uncharacterized protein n=1 Tax=Arundo donax TaxID=35708 RepID=A0A0A9H9A7_ARUDO